jgi:hypothetical protein
MESFRRATPGLDHRHTLGVAMPERRVIVLNCEAIEQAQFEKVTLTLRHEISHIVVGEVAHRTSRRVPLWFDEGVAVWVAGKIPRYDVATFQLRATAGTLLPLALLRSSFPRDPVERGIAYEQSESFVRYVVAKRGSNVVRTILRTAADGEPFERAFESAMGATLAETEAAWRQWLRPRWPLLSWIANAFSLFTGISLLALVAIWVYLVRRRRKYREWEMEDALNGSEDSLWS